MMRENDGQLTTRIVILRSLSLLAQGLSSREPLPRGRLLLFKLRAEGLWLNQAGALRSVHSHPKESSSNFNGVWIELRRWNGRTRAFAPREGLEY